MNEAVNIGGTWGRALGDTNDYDIGQVTRYCLLSKAVVGTISQLVYQQLFMDALVYPFSSEALKMQELRGGVEGGKVTAGKVLCFGVAVCGLREGTEK